MTNDARQEPVAAEKPEPFCGVVYPAHHSGVKALRCMWPRELHPKWAKHDFVPVAAAEALEHKITDEMVEICAQALHANSHALWPPKDADEVADAARRWHFMDGRDSWMQDEYREEARVVLEAFAKIAFAALTPPENK